MNPPFCTRLNIYSEPSYIHKEDTIFSCAFGQDFISETSKNLYGYTSEREVYSLYEYYYQDSIDDKMDKFSYLESFCFPRENTYLKTLITKMENGQKRLALLVFKADQRYTVDKRFYQLVYFDYGDYFTLQIFEKKLLLTGYERI